MEILRLSAHSGDILRASRKRLTAAGIALSLVGFAVMLSSCSLFNPGKRDNVVLIVIDTLRADRLGCYGGPGQTSPNIDTLAAQGTLFEQAITCAPVTLPSVSAILTATYPATNNVRYNGKFFLSDASITLAEILKKNGYKTAAFIGGFPLDSRFKVDQGFDTYDDDFSLSADRRARTWIGHGVKDFERTAAEVNEGAFKWLDTVGDDSFFLMIHYFDPHWPYEPMNPYAEKFQHPYDAEVAYTDEYVGRLLAKLEALGLKDSTLIVLIGDHGESLGAHDEATHGEFLFDTTMRVPLILSHERLIPQGRRIDTMVKTLDIMPTILDFLDIKDSPHSQGVSLLPAFDGKLEEKPILLETMLPYHEADPDAGDVPTEIRGLRTPEWKLIYATFEENGKTHWAGELYNVGQEPLELFDVREQNKLVFMELLKEMITLNGECLSQSVANDNYIEMDDETRRKLESLGYLSK
jgi:arylsulfatase A-like enzyme